MWRTHVAFAAPSVAASTAGAGAINPSTFGIADPALLLVCALGVPIGILAMVGIGISRQKPPAEIKRDLWVAAFMMLANFCFSVIIAARAGLPYLESLGLAIAVSASGSLIAEHAIKKWTKDTKTDAEKRQDDQRLIAAAHIAMRDAERDRKAREVTDEP